MERCLVDSCGEKVVAKFDIGWLCEPHSHDIDRIREYQNQKATLSIFVGEDVSSADLLV